MNKAFHVGCLFFCPKHADGVKSCKAKTVKQDFKKEICDLIECKQVTYEDGELTVAVGDTEVFLELHGEKYINIVTEIADPVEIMNAMRIHNITTRHPAYQELAVAKIEKIKELAIMLADLEEDGENM